MIETKGQLETIEWTKEFLKWLPDIYKSNIFEAMKSIEIGLVLDRPNMTKQDIENIKQAFDILKQQQLATPENIVNLNKIIYHPNSIEIDGILFDRNNLSWWKGIFNEETQERHYNAKGMMKTLKQQNKILSIQQEILAKPYMQDHHRYVLTKITDSLVENKHQAGLEQLNKWIDFTEKWWLIVHTLLWDIRYDKSRNYKHNKSMTRRFLT